LQVEHFNNRTAHDGQFLMRSLFGLSVFFEIGGSGGKNFRYMYSRLLKKASIILDITELINISESFKKSGILFKDFNNDCGLEK
jgi:hypothetical protein